MLLLGVGAQRDESKGPWVDGEQGRRGMKPSQAARPAPPAEGQAVVGERGAVLVSGKGSVHGRSTTSGSGV